MKKLILISALLCSFLAANRGQACSIAPMGSTAMEFRAVIDAVTRDLVDTDPEWFAFQIKSISNPHPQLYVVGLRRVYGEPKDQEKLVTIRLTYPRPNPNDPIPAGCGSRPVVENISTN